MQYSEGKIGRVFALRLEHGDKMPDVLEKFAADKKIQSGMAIMVGGADDGSKFVVGPEDGKKMPPVPMIDALKGVHEVAAVGAIFPDEKGRPQLHMHAAFGRGGKTKSGCIRAGIVTWHVLEIVLIEIVGLDAFRAHDAQTGFALLRCGRRRLRHNAAKAATKERQRQENLELRNSGKESSQENKILEVYRVKRKT